MRNQTNRRKLNRQNSTNSFKHTYSAYDTAAYYLSFREYSRKELKEKLTAKGYDDSEAESAVDRLVGYGYLDDERFARIYIRSSLAKKGSRRILTELSMRGVDPELSRNLLEELAPEEAETILKLMQRRYADLDVADEKQMRRMYSFFAGRGFQYDDIRRAVSEYKKNIEKI